MGLDPVFNLKIEAISPSDIRPHPRNPRRGDLSAIKASLQANGIYRPLIVQRSTGYILAGNHTYLALCDLGATEIPVSFVEVSDESALRILLVDNRSADLGSYDDALLVELLASLPDMVGTGYDEGAMADLMDAILSPTEVRGDPDAAPSPPDDAITSLGDVWRLGDHLVVCGDSCDPETYRAIGGGIGAFDAMWTDPPYGVSYVGSTAEKLTIKNDGAAEARQVVEAFLPAVRPSLMAGAPIYVCHAESQRSYLEAALAESGYLLRQALVWVKDRFVLGRSDYHLQHEPILVGEAPEKDFDHIAYGFTTGGAGRLGRGGPHWHGDNRQTSVFDVARPTASKIHPTMKPVDLIRPMLRNSVVRGGIVVDPFGGSGSTLIAAHMEGRRAALVELDPKYVDVICRRFEEATGIVPIRAATGERVSFVEVGSDGSDEKSDAG